MLRTWTHAANQALHHLLLLFFDTSPAFVHYLVQRQQLTKETFSLQMNPLQMFIRTRVRFEKKFDNVCL